MKQSSSSLTVTHSLRINIEVDKQIERLAASNHVTYTAMANILLSRALQDPQLARPEQDGEK